MAKAWQKKNIMYRSHHDHIYVYQLDEKVLRAFYVSETERYVGTSLLYAWGGDQEDERVTCHIAFHDDLLTFI